MTEAQECPLTEREIEIVKHLADGLTAKGIANKTGSTENSIAMQLKVMRRVTQAKNASHLTAISFRKGWIA